MTSRCSHSKSGISCGCTDRWAHTCRVNGPEDLPRIATRIIKRYPEQLHSVGSKNMIWTAVERPTQPSRLVDHAACYFPSGDRSCSCLTNKTLRLRQIFDKVVNTTLANHYKSKYSYVVKVRKPRLAGGVSTACSKQIVGLQSAASYSNSCLYRALSIAPGPAVTSF